MKKQVWAIVTGASSGIGEEFARIFATHQVNLVITARNATALRTLAVELTRQHHVKVLVFPADLSEQSEVIKLVAYLSKHRIIPDYLINNAGFGDFGYFLDRPWDKEEKMLDLNMKTLTYLTKVYGRLMKARGHGRIVNVASGAAFQPGPMMAVYFATKAYVLHFSEGVAEELSGSGVTVTALCPGATESNFWVSANKANGLSFMPGKMPTAAAVASYGYTAMERGERVAIHGFGNQLGAFLVRFIPRRLVTRVILRGQQL
jgi:hypothetical protein